MKAVFTTATIAALFVATCSHSDAQEPEFFGSNFSISSCVQHAGDGMALQAFMEKKMKVKELSTQMAKWFLGNSKGKAWLFSSPDGKYAVAYREDGICTVFVKETNVAKYIEYMNKNIERINSKSGWKFSINRIPMFAGESKLKSYEMTVSLPQKKVRIVMSAVTKVIGNYQVVFSTSVM